MKKADVFMVNIIICFIKLLAMFKLRTLKVALCPLIVNQYYPDSGHQTIR